jgi:hypothetical protein
MVNYIPMYHKSDNLNYVFTVYHGNYFFSFLMYLGNLLNINEDSFFKIFSIFNFLTLVVGIKLILKKQKYYILAIVLFLLSSTFILIYTNVIRQGLAFSLLVLGIGLFLNKKIKLSYFSFILSLFSHFSIFPILGILYLSKLLTNKKIKLSYIFILPIIIVLGMFLLQSLGQFGGLFNKIQYFAHAEYNNKLVYIKVLIMYGFLFIIYLYGTKYNNFYNYNYRYLYNVYLLSLGLVFFTLPIIALSSRFLYYISGLMPILLTYIFYSKLNLFNLKIRYIFSVMLMLIYGIGIYNFPSIKMQLGI